MKKTVIFTIVITLVFALLTGCGKTTLPPVEDATDTQFGEGVVAIVGDRELTMEDINIYVAEIVPYFQQTTGSAPGWENIIQSSGLTARDEIVNIALENAGIMIGICETLHADGWYSEGDAKTYFAEYVEAMGGEEGYDEILTTYGFDRDAFYDYVITAGAYYTATTLTYTEEEAAELLASNYITAKHVLILIDEDTPNEDAYNAAMEVYNKAVSGENFEALIQTYGEDPGQSPETGYTFTAGEMVEAFYQGALALETGEISEPVRTSYGYHVIKRYDNPAVGSDAYTSAIEKVRSTRANEYLSDASIAEIQANYPVKSIEGISSKIDWTAHTTTE